MAWFSAQILWVGKVIYDGHTLTIVIAALLFQKCCQCVIPIIAICAGLSDRGAFIKNLFDDLVYTDMCFGMIGIHVDRSEIKCFMDRAFLSVTIYSVLLVISLSYLLLKISQLSVYYLFLHLSHILYSNFLIYYYCVLIGSFQFRYKFINDELKSMTMTEFEEKEIINVKTKPNVTETLRKLRTLKAIHAIYREALTIHNGNISVIMVLQILQSVIAVVLSTYFLVCMLLNLLDFRDLGKYMVAVFVLSVIHCFGMVVCTAVVCCSRTCAQVNNWVYSNLYEHRVKIKLWPIISRF